MKILITHCQETTFGGTHLYLNEIIEILKKEHNFILIKGSKIEHNFLVNIDSIDQIKKIKFDLIIIMQSEHYINLNLDFKKTKKVNIIHSEYNYIDAPLMDEFTKYVAIREEIQNRLIDKFLIDPRKIKIILNPINTSFYNFQFDENLDNFFIEKKFGIFVSSYWNRFRFKAMIDFALFCKEMNLHCVLVTSCTSNEDLEILNQLYDKIIEPTKNINKIMKNASLSGGIQKGRTYWEAKLLGLSVVEYIVDENGNIINEIYESATDQKELENIKKMTNPNYVVSQILNWGLN